MMGNNKNEKIDQLLIWLKRGLTNMPVSVSETSDQVSVSYNDRTICAVRYIDESIELFQISDNWRTKTTYPCQKGADSLWFCVIDSIDECVGEVRRLSAFEIEQAQTAILSSGELPNLVWDRDKRKMCESSKIAFLQILRGTDCTVRINGEYGDKNTNPSGRELSLNVYGPEGLLARLWPKPDERTFDVVFQKIGYKNGRVPSNIRSGYGRVSYEETARVVRLIAKPL